MIVKLKLVNDIIEIEIEIQEMGFILKSTVKQGETFLLPSELTDGDLLNQITKVNLINQITKGVNDTIEYFNERNEDELFINIIN